MKKVNPKLPIAVLTLLCVVCTPAFGADADDGLVLHFSFDPGTISNGVVTDESGQGNDGFVEGDPNLVGGALEFDGIDDRIEVPLVPSITFDVGDSFSVMVWVKIVDQEAENELIIGTYGPTTPPQGNRWYLMTSDQVRRGSVEWTLRDKDGKSNIRLDSPDPIDTDEWIHITGVRDQEKKESILYIDGEVVGSTRDTTLDINNGMSIWIGDTLNRFTTGLMDEVRIYNVALSAAEVAELAHTRPLPPPPPNPALAREPQPADREASAIHKAVLTWTPGDYAPAINGHRLYFSESFEDVNDGLDTALIGIQSAARYPESGTGALKFGQTYFWRVDEANDVSGWDIGNVWRFTVEPEGVPIAAEAITVTASSTEAGKSPASTADGSGLDREDLHSAQPADMWLSGLESNGAWIEYAFDKAYTLHEMWVWNYNQGGFEAIGGAKDVIVEYSVNGTDYVALEGVNEFAVAPGEADYAHNTVVDFAGLAAKSVRIHILSNWAGIFPVYGLSEVRFYRIPVWARDPVPAPDANDVNPEPVVLGWKQGRQAASHDVYLGTSEDALDFVGNTSDSYLDVGTLDLGQTYYWRVDEVNEADDPAVWEGELWGFTVSDFIPVDDFESYTDDDASGKAIWQTWIDGLDVLDNGSIVGNFDPPYAEQTTVHDSAQSLSLHYTNTSGVTKSEATRTFDEPQDLTRANIDALSFWFQGHPGAAGVATKLSSGSYSLSAAGAGINVREGADEFHLAYQQTSSGENIIIAKVDSIDSEADGAKAGIMLRDTFDTDSRYAMVAVTPSGGIVFQWRMDIGMLTQSAIVEGTAPCWLKLERTGIGYCKAYHSPDGTEGSWVQLGLSQLIFMAAPAAGLAMTSGDVAEASEATFSGITINGAAPADLVSQDIASISNDAEPVYVALEDADGDEIIVVHEDPDATLTPLWQEWRIDLGQLAADNARFDLTTVRKMTLGVGARDAATDGGSGVLYVDDIRLYPTVIQ